MVYLWDRDLHSEGFTTKEVFDVLFCARVMMTRLEIPMRFRVWVGVQPCFADCMRGLVRDMGYDELKSEIGAMAADPGLAQNCYGINSNISYWWEA